MIYIIRHGQTKMNKEWRLLGRSDEPLNENGRLQAAEAGEFFKDNGITFDRCYSSPLQRAVATAEIVTGFRQGDEQHLILDDQLLEMDYGPYEGADLQHPPEEIVYFFQDFAHHPAPEGMEQLSHVVQRLGVFLENLPYQPCENILLSTHAIAMKGALEYLTPVSHGSYWSKYIGNCSIYSFDKIDGHFTIPSESFAGDGGRR